jgi:hypothetical protein
MNPSRRSLLSGLIAAPAVILTPGLLMPVRRWIEPFQRIADGRCVKFYKNGQLVGMAPLVPQAPGAFSWKAPPERSTFCPDDIIAIEFPDLGVGEYRAIPYSEGLYDQRERSFGWTAAVSYAA